MWSEKLLASVFSSSSAPILVVRQDDRTIVDCNPAALSLLGWSRGELVGQRTSFLCGDLLEWTEVARRSREIMDSGEVADLRIRALHRDGRSFPVRVRGQAFIHDGIAYNSVVVEDLSEIEAAHEALRQEVWAAGERVKELRCIYSVSELLQATERPLTERLAGIPGHLKAAWQFPQHAHAEIVVGAERYVTPGYTEGVARQRQDVRVDGVSVGRITVSYDGNCPATGEGLFLEEEQRLLDAIAIRIGAALERERVEEERRRTENRLHFISEALPISIAILDWTTSEILYTNARARRDLGIGWQDHPVTLNVDDYYVDPEDRMKLRALLERDGVIRDHMLQVRLGGMVRWHSIHAELIDFEGRRAVYVARLDVTDQRNTQEALRQAQKLKTIGQLAGGVAHDFNNLLTVLSMQLEMMAEEGNLDASAQERIARANSVVEKGASLTRQLLSFARQQVLKPNRLDACRLAREMKPFLTRTLGTNIGIDVATSPDELWIRADKGLLESAILNLCINARDAMPSGGNITIAVSPSRSAHGSTGSEGAAGQVEIAVSDTGTGMTPDVQARVFEPFFTTKETEKGTGLGLSMVHGFVMQSGGTVDIESAPGRGTKVRIFLPADLDVPAHTDERAGAVARGRERVLLVDDNDALRKPLAYNLQRLGYEVSEAIGGADALSQISATPPDLIVTDMMMPGMSGVDLIAKVRERHALMPVVLVSGQASDAIHAVLSLPRVAFCAKPFTTRELAARIRELLDPP